MKLSTGKVAFPIEFDNGDKAVIYFNPNDPDLATRLMAAKDKIDAKMQTIQTADFDVSADGETAEIENIDDFMHLSEEQAKAVTEKAERTAKIIQETKAIIFEELDTAFGGDISSVVFKHCSPFAVVNGEYFFVQFLSAIAPEIQKNIDKSNIELQNKMAKHLNKYSK